MTATGAAKTASDLRLTRRGVLQAAAGLTFGFVVGGVSAPQRRAVAAESRLAPNAWVNIAVDGTITIYTPADEMGQGSMTALPIILAEELDAEWNDVRIEFSPSDDEIYGNPGYFGLLTTQASATLAGYYDQLRHHGAQARRVLLDNVAARWGVAVDELTTEPSVVVHEKSGRRISYGELVGFATMPSELPWIGPGDLKKRTDFRLIGHDLSRRDIPSKVDGSAQYSIDVRLPGMVYAIVVRPPVRGAQPLRVDESEARAVSDVIDIVSLPYGFGIVSNTYEGALAAERKLEIEWSQVEGSNFDGEEELEVLMGLARDRTRADSTRGEGSDEASVEDIEAALDGAASIYDAEYRTDFLYQAQMEPLNSVAWVKEGGKSVEIWAGTQAATHLVRAAAKALEIPAEKVTLHRMFLGGGFGRRCDMDHNWAVDAILLSRAVGRPVKAIWTREHDVQFGRFKPISAHCLRCGVDDQDHIVGWHHRSVVQDVASRADPYLSRRFREARAGKRQALVISRGREFRYDLKQRRESVHRTIAARISWMRGVSTSQNEFASESFMDEVAAARGIDPIELRLRILPAGRPHQVLRTAADMADWGGPGKRSLGVAYTPSFGTIMATIAEVIVDDESGVIKVPHLWVAVDVGIAVQPLNVIGQVEGAVIYALSNALYERVSIKEGRVQQSNFHDYPVLRMAEVPEINVEIVDSDQPPTGVGDRAMLGVAPAVANAFSSFTGRRLRHMPMTPERVRKVLAGPAARLS